MRSSIAEQFRRSAGAPISDKQLAILDAAAALFAEKGYKATSIRDIGNRVGILGGSLYHYIKSKEALFIQIHDAALELAESEIRQSVAGVTDPWERLELASRTLLQIQLHPASITMPIMNDFRSIPNEMRQKLVPRRDRFEQLFNELVADLPLNRCIDRSIFRLSLLTLLNNVESWYRDDRLSPEQIARQIVMSFRVSNDEPSQA